MGEKRRGKEKEREKIFALLGKFLLSCDNNKSRKPSKCEAFGILFLSGVLKSYYSMKQYGY